MGKLVRNLIVLASALSVAPVAAHQRPAQPASASAVRHDPSNCPFERAKAEAAARDKAIAIAIVHSKANARAEGSLFEVQSEAPQLLP